MAKKRSSLSLLRGRVLSHNISPKGRVEGVLVEHDDGIAQVNYPKHVADDLAHRLPIGSAFELEVELDDDHGDHPVYLAKEADQEITGTVTRFNYTHHGKVNGYHLDGGLLVHVKPEGAKRHKVRIGDTISVTGERHKGPDAIVIEAERVKKLDKPQ